MGPMGPPPFPMKIMRLFDRIEKKRIIDKMPAEVRERYMAAFVTEQRLLDVKKEMFKEKNKLAIKTSKLMEPFLQLRAEVIAGKHDLTKEQIEEFDKKAEEIMASEGYDKVKVTPKDTQDMEESKDDQSVPNFWLEAMLTFPPFKHMISKDDKQALKSL
jgi:hypothetical protein